MDKASPQSWSLIIFCYNEEGNLRKVAGQALDVLEQIAPVSKELIIVDDGSTDNTFQVAQTIAASNAVVKIIRHKKNIGIGSALRSGYSTAQYENICAIPGDGQFDVNELLLFPIVPPKTFISFYRSYNLQYSLWRETLSFINKKLNEWILRLKIRDVNWVKIYKREELQKFSLALHSSLVESEICTKLLASDNRIVEVKSKYLERTYGKDKGASGKIVWQAFTDMYFLVKEYYRFKRSIRK